MAGYICALAISLFASYNRDHFHDLSAVSQTCLQRTGNGKRN